MFLAGLLNLRWQDRDDLVVATDFADFGGAAWRTDHVEELNICLVIVSPLRWQVVFVIDCFDRANWLAGTAVDAFIRVNIEHAVALIDAVDWAFLDAGLVFHINARQCNHISQLDLFPSNPDANITLRKSQVSIDLLAVVGPI